MAARPTGSGSRRGLQGLLIVCALIPLVFGTLGLTMGLDRLVPDPAIDADNVYRFLSGLYFTMGLLFLYVVPRVEEHTALIRLLAAGVALGALGRVLSWIDVGEPRLLFRIDVIVETVIPLVVVLWQARVAARFGGIGQPTDPRRP